jgi:2-iminobutanoate/2-iminopropanoate deaminase
MIERTAFAIDPVSPYSKVIRAGDLVYIKSNIGMNADGTMPDDVADEATSALEHLVAVGAMAGTGITKLLKLNIYLADADRDAEVVRATARSFFGAHPEAQPPAFTMIGSALSWPQLRVQLDAIALA